MSQPSIEELAAEKGIAPVRTHELRIDLSDEEAAAFHAALNPTVKRESINVPEHTTERLTIPAADGDWVFTSIRTGCIRVQRGDFCAYIPVGKDGMMALAQFVIDHSRNTMKEQVLGYPRT